MITVYVYILDTLADWELGYVTAELNSKRFFKKDAPDVSVKMAGVSQEPVRTMGGLTVTPDCAVSDIAVNENSVLLLPGAAAWALWCAPSVGPPLRWQMPDCWTGARTPAMGRDTLRCARPATRGSGSMWISPRLRIAV